jgi:hypothetical protein
LTGRSEQYLPSSTGLSISFIARQSRFPPAEGVAPNRLRGNPR